MIKFQKFDCVYKSMPNSPRDLNFEGGMPEEAQEIHLLNPEGQSRRRDDHQSLGQISLLTMSLERVR